MTTPTTGEFKLYLVLREFDFCYECSRNLEVVYIATTFKEAKQHIDEYRSSGERWEIAEYKHGCGTTTAYGIRNTRTGRLDEWISIECEDEA